MAYASPTSWSLLSFQNLSGVSLVEFKSCISSNYLVYHAICSNVVFTNDGDVNLVFSTDNGSTYLSSNYNTLFYFHATDGFTGLNSNTGTASALIQSVVTKTDAQNWNTYFYNMNTTKNPMYQGDMTHNDTIGGFNNAQHAGMNTTTTAITAIKFTCSAGTMTGKFYFYGGNYK